MAHFLTSRIFQEDKTPRSLSTSSWGPFHEFLWWVFLPRGERRGGKGRERKTGKRKRGREEEEEGEGEEGRGRRPNVMVPDRGLFVCVESKVFFILFYFFFFSFV